MNLTLRLISPSIHTYTGNSLGAVLSIRIRSDLKEKMKKYKIDWRKEIEQFIENRIKELEAEEKKERIETLLESVEEKERGFASSVIRLERDSL